MLISKYKCSVTAKDAVSKVLWFIALLTNTYSQSSHCTAFIQLGMSVLMNAVRYGHVSIVRLLAEKYGCSVSETDLVSVMSEVHDS